MDEGSSYCGCGSEIDDLSNVAKITNMVMTSTGQR